MTTNEQLFNSDPRSYALELVKQEFVRADHMLLCMLNHMSHDDVRGALDANELSPRFDEEAS
jgi:hypothetical protein